MRLTLRRIVDERVRVPQRLAPADQRQLDRAHAYVQARRQNPRLFT